MLLRLPLGIVGCLLPVKPLSIINYVFFYDFLFILQFYTSFF